VLSQNLREQLDNFLATHAPALYQTRYALDMRYELRRQVFRRTRGIWLGLSLEEASIAVERSLLLPTRVASIIGGAAFVRFMPTMRRPAAERASKIVPAGVARIGDEEHPAVDAAHQATPGFRVALENKPKD
jgi:hypothetical protein